MGKIFTGVVILLTLFTSPRLYGANYFWVGGTGSWTELTHWATTSGGSTKHVVLPTLSDDVFFDTNSFSAAGQTVTVTDGATFRNMDWSGSTNSPTITCSFLADVNVYGSLILPATIVRNFSGNLHFKATSGNHNVNLGNLPLRSPDNETLYFEGVGGTWTLTGGISQYGISLTGGTLNTNGQPVTCSVFGTTGSTAQGINLGSSVINIGTWNITSSNITVNAGTSSITSTFSFNGKNLTYNNLIISGSVAVNGNNTFNTITLNASSILRLKEGTTQTISGLISNGTTANPATIKSVTDGSTATLYKSSGTVAVNYVRIQDNIATGGATFTAPIGSVDLGNVTGWDITAITPTVQTSFLSRSKVLPTSVELRWTNGNGSRRIVLAKALTAINSAPVNLTAYTAAAFSTGTQIGTGNYVVYSGNADRATITGLTANTLYHFAVYEFNGTGTSSRFLTTSPAITSATTLPATAVIISNSPVSVCSGKYYDSGGDGLYNYSNNESFIQTLTPSTVGNKLRLTFADFFTSGTGDVLKIYDGADVSAPLLGSFTGSAVPGVITATNAAGKLTIQFNSDAFTSSTGWDATISCITLDTEPTTTATSLLFANVTGSAMRLSWTNGTGKKRIVIAKQGGAVNFTPTDANDYTANASFGSGANLNTGNFVVYNGTSSSVDITNLIPNTTYYFSVFEYTGANTSANYRTTGTIAAQATTNAPAKPTIASSAVNISFKSEASLEINWTNGNGARRVVVVKQGSAVNALPVDGTLYTPTNNLATTPAVLSGGNKIVYSGSGNNVVVSGLNAQTSYYVAVFEFNGTTAGITNYLTTTPGITSASTLATPPTTNPTLGEQNIVARTFTSISLQWASAGSAEKYIVVLEKSPSSVSVISDGIEYTGNAVFGQGTQAGNANAFVVYTGTGNSVNVTGLQPNTQYTYRIYGYNGSGIFTNYLNTGIGRNFYTLKSKPTVQASALVVSNVASDSLRVTWQRGNGDYSLVVFKEGAPVSVNIKDSTVVDVYTTNYGSGVDLGNGNTVVYKSTGNSVSIKKLAPGTTYHIAVYELNTTSSYNYFLTDNPPTATATTLNGKNYYWVGGTGKWSEYTQHWATASGGSTFHTAVPSTSDNVYFDAASFSKDTDSVYIDQNAINANDMDWTGITKKASFASVGTSRCSRQLYIYGSLKLSDLMNIEFGYLNFYSTSKGKVIHMANKTTSSVSCSGSITFQGYGGEWTLTGNLNFYRLYLYSGSLIANNSQLNIPGSIELGSNQPRKMELGNSIINTPSLTGGNVKSLINGGRFTFNTSQNTIIQPGEAHFKKVVLKGVFNTTKILGKISFDSLMIDPGREVQFEAGKTYTIDKFILNGDSTRTTSILSTNPGSAAIFSKATGAVNINYVILRDNIAQGGAQFTANNSVNNGNVSGWNIIVAEIFVPKRSASSLVFRRVFRDNLKIKWTKGDGIKRLVIAKENTAVDRYPTNGKFYTANTVFATGSDLGNGNFVVYDGLSDTTSLTGFTEGKKYHFAVIEYNTWNGAVKYKISGPAINSVSTVGTKDVIFSNTPVTVCNVKFFDEGGNGFYTENQNITQTITPETNNAKLGVLFTYFEMPSFDSLIVYDGTSTAAPILGKFRYTTKPTKAMIATNASGALTFKLKGNNSSETEESFKGWIAELFCVGTPANEPTTQTTALAITSKTESSLTVKATKGNGAGRMIIAKEASAVSQLPIDGTAFTANSSFGEGTHLGGGNYVVYSGTDETVTINGLKGNTPYHFASVEFNGTQNSTNYLLTNPALAKDSTQVAKPTLASTDLTFINVTTSAFTPSFFAGNGSSRLIVVRKWKDVAFAPNDGVSYPVNIVGGQSVGDSTYVVSNSFYSNTVFNLEQSTRYHIKIFEFNGAGIKTKYLTTSTLSGKVTTKGPVVTMNKIKATYCPNEVVTVPFRISTVFNANNKYTLQLSDASGNFGSPVILKDTTINALQGVIRAKIPNGVSESSSYRIRILTSSPITVSDSIRTISIPHVPDVTVTQDGSAFVSSISSNIQWLKNGVAINGATSAAQNFIEDGVYTVKVTENGCYKTSSPIVIMGLENEGNGWSLYPNPAQDVLGIDRTFNDSASFEVYDTQGRELMNGILSNQNTQIDVKTLPQGLYFIRVISGQSSSVKKLIKK